MSARERFLGHGRTALPSGHSSGTAEAAFDELEDAEFSQGRRKEDIEFIPLPSNAGFFGGESRTFPYMYYGGAQCTRDYERIDLFFAAIDGKYKITLTGYGLKGLFLKIKARMVATIRQADALQAAKAVAANPTVYLVTGLTAEPMPERDSESAQTEFRRESELA